jgi:predicted Ser/Thr protein kinase
MTDEKYSYWVDKHSSDPSVFYEEFLDALYNEDEVNLDSFLSSIKVIDYLMKTLDHDLDDDSRHLKRVVNSSASEEETQILETIDACKEILEDTSELKNEVATRKLINLRGEIGEWFEEIIVFVAEYSEIPEDLFPWFFIPA